MRTRDWLTHFETNASNLLPVAHDGYRLTEQERERITTSIQSFQLGESSEGHILRAQAHAYSEEIDRPEYLGCIEHLIREENRHSAYLLAFMRQQGIPRIKKGINDFGFRFLRRLAGIEMSARVLVTAEIIALTYYDCLGAATRSRTLALICDRMLEEERTHIRFQMQHVHEMNLRKHSLFSSLANLAHAALVAIAVGCVWMEHREVLRAKHSFRSFAGIVWRDFTDAQHAGELSAARALVEEGFLSEEALCI